VISLEPDHSGKRALAFDGDVELVEAVTLDSVHVATRQRGTIRGTLQIGEQKKPVSAVQQKAPLKPLALSHKWVFQTQKPNALPLTDWTLKMEASVGWCSAKGWHSYSCRFNSSVKPKQARLLVDGLVIEKIWRGPAPVNAKFQLNGQDVKTFEKGQYLDHFILEADVSQSIKRGDNHLTVTTAGILSEIPSLAYPPILVGAFSVERGEEEDGWVVRAPKSTIATGDWSEQGFPFYSGIGIYSQQVEVPSSFAGERLMLELEAVGDLAEVVINGKNVAVLAWEPYQADVTNYIRPGKNEITLKVANSLQNLLCLKPKPSGILGEVRIVPYHRVTLK
jgi:hypothetical protein